MSKSYESSGLYGDERLDEIADQFGGLLRNPDRGFRLRRCSSVEALSTNWDLLCLLSAMPSVRRNDQLWYSLWAVSAAQAPSGRSLADLARAHGISEKRWRKLTSTRERSEASRQLRRIVRQLSECPIPEVIKTLFYWSDRSRRQLAMDWFKLNTESDISE